jgi:hypothetical protein
LPFALAAIGAGEPGRLRRFAMAGSSLQEMYVRLLLDRVQGERFPNPEHLDRIEAALSTPDQLREYVVLLLDKVSGMKHPSPALLDRLQRFAAMQQKAPKQA